jgi:hypothetical protein
MKSKIVKHITRGWDEVPGYKHPLFKILPPFLFDLIAYLFAGALLYQIVVYIWDLF